MAVDLTPHPLLSVNLGIGKGLQGVQVAAMARVRPLLLGRVFALGLGGGVSRGDARTYTQPFSCCVPPQLRFAQATWLNGEVFMELRQGRLHLRPFLGVARRVAYSDCVFDDRQSAISNGTVRPCAAIDERTLDKHDDIRTIGYTGVAIGFGLL